MSNEMHTFIQAMPKAELHCHIEGTIEPAMVRALAKRNNMTLPPALEALEKHDGFSFHDLTSFLAVYYPAMSVLKTADDFYDLAYAYLTKCKEQNVVHTEIFFDPQAHTSRGVPFPAIIGGLRRALIRAELELDMSAGLILCFLRDMSAEFAMATLMEALPYRDWIIGVGLDSDERDNPPSKFAAVFARARSEGFMVTCHCDIDQPNSIDHIRQCLEDIKVDRIDHGSNIVESQRLVDLAIDRRIGFTCCPVSNSVCTDGFKGKEIIALLSHGAKVTINSDDPSYFRAYMNENLAMMVDGVSASKQELLRLQMNAFEVSWIPSTKKDRFMWLLRGFAMKYCPETSWEQLATFKRIMHTDS